MSSSIPIKDMKILCIRSGNRCAFPNCNTLLVKDKTNFDVESIVADMAHIKGEKPKAPRYDENMDVKDRNSYFNLILLCKTHHKIVDDQPNTYTVEKLHEMKTNHEKWIIDSTKKEVINVSFVELNTITKYLVSGQSNVIESYTIITPKDKINKNGLSDEVESLITMAMTRVNQVSDFIDKCPDIDFGKNLKQGFVHEYNKLKNEAGLIGDDLFYALLNFASGKSNDFKEKAAGLTVLVYLFEKCEVFEK
ncbi:MAG: hypothetical protein GF364_15620 [Candidatus Lokiarchaeota archaeon]|nr:hypothetical protein [Candidatus Lokiarchaeota archaeon]